jgi:hypothetical protein
MPGDCLKEVVAMENEEVLETRAVFGEEMKAYLREIIRRCSGAFGSFPSGNLKLAVKRITGV